MIVIENRLHIRAAAFAEVVYPDGEGSAARIADRDNVLQHFERLSVIGRIKLLFELDGSRLTLRCEALRYPRIFRSRAMKTLDAF